MSTTLNITADRARDDLRTGDRIIALDGTLLPHARTVANPKHLAGLNKVPAINLVNETGSDVEWNLYLHNFDEVTVERSREARSEGDVVADPGEVVVAATEEKNNDKSDENLIERADTTVAQSSANPIVPTGRTSVARLQPGEHVWLSAMGAYLKGRRDLASPSNLRSAAALALHEVTTVVSVTRRKGEYLATVRTAAGTVHKYPPQSMLATAPPQTGPVR